MNVYAGIDVACAKRKPLPICFVTHVNGALEILIPPIEFLQNIPRGLGNKEVLNRDPFVEVAQKIGVAFRDLSKQFGWNIKRIAIDAPAAAPREGKRESELALSKAGVKCIWTPDRSAWKERIKSSRDHLNNDGAVTHLPGANQIWMLYGFALFKELRKIGLHEVFEVYPYSIMRSLLENFPHKSSSEGYSLQLKTIANATGVAPEILENDLRRCVRGSSHDRLDAYMAAWLASMGPEDRTSFGSQNDPDDRIWIPRGNYAAAH
jgi:predicted nuclease with RNAse H fold